ADHCHGLDDLRQLYHAKGRPIEGYARTDTLESLQHRFAYAFYGRDGYPPSVTGHLLPDQMRVGDMELSIVDQPHGNITSAGIRVDKERKSAAYSTDFNAMTSDMEALFQGLDLWV